MYKFSLRIAIGAVLILISSISIFSQKYDPNRPQVIEGCSASPYNYPESPPYSIYRDINIPLFTQVDRIETGTSRFIFTFSPDKGSYSPGYEYNPTGDKIRFSVFNYGSQTNSFHQEPPPPERNPGQTEESYRLNRPPPLTRLDLARYSTLSVEERGILNWDETYLKRMASSGTWYAISKYAGPLDAPRPDNGAYLSPIPADQLPADSAEVKVWPNPVNYYSYDGNPGKPSTGDGILSAVRRLSPGLDLDVTGWTEGYYWFTLQSEANFGGQKCQKTTPPVLIEVRKPTTVSELKVTVQASAKDCDYGTGTPGYVTATAKLYYKYLKREDITVTWEVWDPAGNPVKDGDYEKSYDGLTVTVNKALQEGQYKFTVTATADGRYKKLKSDATAYANYKECPTYETPGVVGIVYFQFEVPYPGEENTLTKPEEWTRDRRKQGRNKHPKYPTMHKPGALTTPVAFENNTEMLDKIAEQMKDGKLKLYIFGFTDIETTKTYSNYDLADRRIKVVLKYLEDKGVPMGNVNSAIIRNCSDKYADYRGKRWSDLRRWDRSVELFYVDPSSGPQPNPKYIDNCKPK